MTPDNRHAGKVGLVGTGMVGSSFAFALTMLVFGFKWKDFLACMATLPMWILIARLYHLYDQDEERTHHPTTKSPGCVCRPTRSKPNKVCSAACCSTTVPGTAPATC